MRLSIAFIWIWTAIVSWFVYPRTESLDWLHRLGLTYQINLILFGACIVDMVMGVASLFFASRRLWLFQMALVMLYSLAIIIRLPEFLFHPFGPVIKNIVFIACLVYLIFIEDYWRSLALSQRAVPAHIHH